MVVGPVWYKMPATAATMARGALSSAGARQAPHVCNVASTQYAV